MPVILGFLGLLVINPIPGFGETFEIGWMIIQVDLIGDNPYRVDLSLCPLGGCLFEGDSAKQVICEALLLSTGP